LTFGQSDPYKSCSKYSNLPPCKILTLSISFNYYPTCLENQQGNLNWKIFPARFSPRRPSAAASRPKSHVRGWPITVCVPQSPPPGVHLSLSLSPIPSPALADPHRRHDSGQTATRVFGQGCLVLPHRIPLLPSIDCRPSRPLALLRTVVSCRSMPQCRGQALAAKGPAQRSLLAPTCMHRLRHRLAPPSRYVARTPMSACAPFLSRGACLSVAWRLGAASPL
jgi:hypothetical protein